MNAIFDVGADDGFHGILFAFLNPKIKVFAFEPIKGSKKRILNNLKKIEIFFKIKLKNYKIINNAISDFNGHSIFYETNYKVASSLYKPKNKLDKYWTTSKDLLIKTVSKGLKVKKKYKVKVITLNNFCKLNSIKQINYLHIDAQGHDLQVISGLKNFKEKLYEGVVEVPSKHKLRIYDKEQSFHALKKQFKKWKFDIINIEKVQKNHPSYNVYFRNKNFNENNINNVIFKKPTKRIERMFKRIFIDKTNFKDLIHSYLYLYKRF